MQLDCLIILSVFCFEPSWQIRSFAFDACPSPYYTKNPLQLHHAQTKFIDRVKVIPLLMASHGQPRIESQDDCRRGAFVVERVEYLFCCESREAGWVRDMSVYVSLFVREN